MYKTRSLRLALLIVAFAWLFAACARGATEAQPPEIRYGETICEQCKMIISDERFAAGYAHEISPGRYESIAFDDIGDMLAYADVHPDHAVTNWYVHDFNSKEWLDATQAHFVFSNNLQTPMGQGTAAFADKAAAEAMAAELDGVVMDWSSLRQRFEAGELAVHAHRPESTTAMDHDAMHELAHDEDDTTMHSEETILGEAEIDGYHLQIVSHGPLHAGYNVVMAHLTDASGNPVSDAKISFAPQMSMQEGMTHSAGVEQPAIEMPGMYHGAIAFPMPSGPDLGSWTLAVSFTDPATGASGATRFDINVAPSQLIGSFVASDDSKIFLSVVEPTIPGVGVQPFEVFAMQKASATDWPPLDDLTLEITPWMPTMDHGSPNNENPVSTGGGHYLGQINFTMAGPWTVTVAVSRDQALLGEVTFEYDIP